MRSHWPTAISTEPPCTQLTPSSANEHVENADTRGAEIAQNEPLPIDPLENADTPGAEIAQNEALPIDPLEYGSAPGDGIAQDDACTEATLVHGRGRCGRRYLRHAIGVHAVR